MDKFCFRLISEWSTDQQISNCNFALSCKTSAEAIQNPKTNLSDLNAENCEFFISISNNELLLLSKQAVINNDIAMLTLIEQHSGGLWNPAVRATASRFGNNEIIELCETKQFSDLKTCSLEACKYGQIDILEWLKVHFPGSGWLSIWELANIAARFGHTHILNWLSNYYYVDAASLYCLAAQSGQVSTLQWIYNFYSSILPFRICEQAIAYGQLPALKWLVQHNAPLYGDWLCPLAAKNKHCHIISFLLEQGCKWDSSKMSKAAGKSQSLTVVHFVEKTNERLEYPTDYKSLFDAAHQRDCQEICVYALEQLKKSLNYLFLKVQCETFSIDPKNSSDISFITIAYRGVTMILVIFLQINNVISFPNKFLAFERKHLILNDCL